MANRIWQPPADVFRCAGHWYVKLELAGIAPGELSISAQRDTLSISGSRKDTQLKANPFYHSLEITYSNFNRTVTLPFAIDEQSIRWEYRDGMLLIQLDSQPGGRRDAG